MDENLIKLLTDQMTPGVLGKLGSVLGESEEATGKAVNAAIPGIMGALMKNGANEEGATNLMGMMDNLPGGLDLGNIAGLLSNQDESKTLLTSGNSLVSGLLGGGSNKMFDLISSVSGIGRAKSGNLMGLLAPIAMGMLKNKMRGGGLGAAGLAGMLLGQRNFLKAAAPNGLTEALGLSSFDDIGSSIGQAANVNVGINDVAANVGNTVSGAVEGGTERIRGAASNAASGAASAAGNMANNAGGALKGAAGVGAAGVGAAAATGGKVARGGMGLGRWLLPLIGLLVLVALLWWLFTSGILGGNRGGNVELPGTGAITGTVDGVSGAVSGAVDGATGAVSGAVDGVTGAVSGAVDGAAGAVGGVVDGATGAVSGAVDGVTGAVDGVSGAVSGAVDGATGAVSGAVDGVSGAVSGLAAGAIPADVLSGVCGSVSGLTASFGSFPALSADTELGAVVDGVNAVRTPIEGILAAAGSLGIPGLDSLTNGFNGLREVVGGITGTTLGESAGAVGTAFEGLKTAGTGFADGLNCSN